MTLLPRIALATMIGLGIGAIDAAAQTGPQNAPGQPPAVAAPSPLTADQIKTVVAGRLVLMRSDLKVGKVSEKDANTYDVELLKADGTVSEHALVDKVFARPAGALTRHGRHGGMGGMGHPGMGGMAGGCPMGMVPPAPAQ
ncbi:MAG: hypothetical protein ACM31D_04975 [Bacteroidota bacterium]